ncbi:MULTISPECIES: AAA family ATPase [unclassified Pantoea]|uniref:AAA family ATPase n=1 Tax=unclassified Pantoea TaxID=2630326 RepID=UPI001CD2D08F|nr:MULTISPECIES: AAA family ATPase [unclassified Pantoea]MCA1179508.1 ATP-binding protein [Pantoea sp. alder69]MCA1251761.1 ATP-binding protein [Pantoea sp. alder70]MCA1267902.1 ATP-binding protein [Pantoea sp. alder81]
MKICFLWTEKFKGLNNFGINLSSEHHYTYDKKNNKLTRKEKNKIPNGIYTNHLANISGILGSNGTGKTTILELICLSIKGNDEINNEFLVVYEHHGSYFYKRSKNGNYDISSDFEINSRSNDKAFENLDVIFFSNVFDQNYLELGSDVQDVSVNNKYIKKGFSYKHSFEKDFSEELRFINSEEFSLLEYDSPEIAIARISKEYLHRINNNQIKNLETPLTCMRDLYYRQRKSDFLTKTILLIQLTHLAQIYDKYIEYSNSKVIEVFNENFDISNEQLPNLNKVIHELIVVLTSGDVANFKDKDRHYCEILIDLADVHDLLLKANFKHVSQSRQIQLQFQLTFNKKDINDFERLSNLILKMPSSNIKWDYLSSGQKAYLNMFSSIWNAVRKQKNDDKLICIDEGDLYLHPKWQLEFIQKITKVISELSNGRIHIIITTHSPILVSDLPVQCLSTLIKRKNNTIDAENGLQTFGANIFDIYRETFEIDNQKTGNISKNYMDKIISILDKAVITEREYLSLKESLLIIGDKILSHHISKRVNKEKNLFEIGG